MEHKKIFKKERSPYSLIHGFSLNNEKINPGEYLLTEIPGNIFSSTKYPKCSNQANIFLKNFVFMNDSRIITFKDFDFIEKETEVTQTYIEENVSENSFTKIFIN